ncbi:hypothetical protein VDG1235_2731 [Verrucomicrobiia bacterium DG1235]|nr:hypothetical protein VDG1235_2731 [Verrucomicrobiae bacterium DG1235]
MKCLERIDTHARSTRQTISALLLLTLLLGYSSALGANAINIKGDNRVTLPGLVVTSSPQRIHSGTLLLSLSNKNETNGWVLSGEVNESALIGSATAERIPATLTFQSISWLSGGNGSTAGITVYPDGTRIEADPGFGLGNYQITFEIYYDAPAFPIADSYRGVSTFTVQ